MRKSEDNTMEEEINKKIREAAGRVEVPKSLKPEAVCERLKKKENAAFGRKRHLRRWVAGGVAAAACLLLAVTATLTVSGRKDDRGPVEISQKSDASGVAREDVKTTYAMLCDAVNRWNKNGNYSGIEGYSDDAMVTRDTALTTSSSQETTGSQSAETNDYSETDCQVDGVTEGDIVKTDGSYIYTTERVLTGCRIHIYHADKKKTKELSAFQVKECDVREMYLSGDQLVLLTRKWPGEEMSQTEIVIYNISDRKNPEETIRHTQSGTCRTSRMYDGFLYTFSEYRVYGSDYLENEPETYVPQADGSVIKESDIQMMDEEEGNSYMVMTSLNMENPDKFTDTFSVFSGGSVYYMSGEHIYVTQSVEGETMEDMRTRIGKFDFSGGIFTKGKTTEVRGSIQNSYYMHEYGDSFCFVYTRYRNNSTVNGLCIMNDQLEVTGELTGLGEGETIYSSYFMDNMAYFVTYRDTDPVFAVDLSNPKKPRLCSELKLSGFSDYLHSFGDGRLLGIGQGETGDVMGVKLSLFSLSENGKIKETKRHLLRPCTETEAGDEHRAVFVDEERGLVGFGVTNYRTGKDSYQLYRLEKGEFYRVCKVNRVSSYTNVRGVRIGEYFYVVDVEKGIRAYKL